MATTAATASTTAHGTATSEKNDLGNEYYPGQPSQLGPPPQPAAVYSYDSVMYNPQVQMPVTYVQQVIQLRPEEFITDYRVFSLVIIILFGMFGPISLAMGIPAYLYAKRSIINIKEGKYEEARTASIASAHLTIGTMFISILSSTIFVGLFVGFRFQLGGAQI